jgi:hypothetical protein
MKGLGIKIKENFRCVYNYFLIKNKQTKIERRGNSALLTRSEFVSISGR